MQIIFDTAEKLKAKREKAFLEMTPNERFWCFVQSISFHGSFARKKCKREKNNFVITKSKDWNSSTIQQ